MVIIKKLMCVGVALALLGSCASRGPFEKTEFITLEATGYCKCGECCGWKRNLLMQPVYAYGSMKGDKKKIGDKGQNRDNRSGHQRFSVWNPPESSRLRVGDGRRSRWGDSRGTY